MEQNANIKPIQLQGIVRNETKIGVQDGQAEDLLNLRFTDGSWRASGDGRLINFTMGVTYTQLYVHTNVYHHLLGVAPDTNNGNTPTLWWFANIANDGVTFEALATPVKLTTVAEGDIWITQTGHLLTVIDAADDFEHLVYKTGEEKYIEAKVDVNGKAADRSLFPFGQVHFNCYCPCDTDHLYSGQDVSAVYQWFSLDIYYETIKNIIKKKNQFAQPFLAIAAVKLYDGSYVYASNPIYIHPREKFNNLHEEEKGFVNLGGSYVNTAGSGISNVIIIDDRATYDAYLGGDEETVGVEKLNQINNTQFPTIVPYGFGSSDAGKVTFSDSFDANGDYIEGGFLNYLEFNAGYYFFALGSDLVLSIDSDTINTIKGNEDIISSLCIFITTEADLYKAREKDQIITVEGADPYTRPKGTLQFERLASVLYKYHQGSSVTINKSFTSRAPKLRENAQIINDLKHSPFYLLREYKLNELGELLDNPIVNLTDPEDEGLLENLVQQNRLEAEALSRTTYLPKTTYQYNNRLHIANYKSYPFFGYPIDLFHLHNHSVKVESGKWFPNDTTQKVLPNLTSNNDEYLQYTKEQIAIKNTATLGDAENEDGTLAAAAAPYFLVKVYIDSFVGEQVVCRYIPAYDYSSPEEGRADFIEDLNPLLTYPDARAKKMEIYFVDHYLSYGTLLSSPGYYVKRKEFTLKPHPYLNMAYFINPDLKPIKLSEFGGWPVLQPLEH